MSSAWHGPVACTLARWLNSDQPRENPPLCPRQFPTPSAHPRLSYIPVFHCRPRQLGCPRPNPREERLEGQAGVQAGQAGRQTRKEERLNRGKMTPESRPSMGVREPGRAQRRKQERRWGSNGGPDTRRGQLLCEQMKRHKFCSCVPRHL